jgi:solute carrier family 45 protein 1/2/4
MIRASGVGNIMGYLAGNIKLPKYLPWLGGTQFKVLSAIASFILGVTVAISCFSCGERDPTYDAEVEDDEGVFAFFKSLSRSIKKLPPQISRVCQVQFFAWIGWFPFLFYITTYVGQIYVNPKLKANPNMTDAEIDKVWEDATRVGTRALLIFAITTFTTSIFLPFIIPPTYEAPQAEPAPMTPTTPRTPGGSRSAGDYFGHKPAVARTPRTPGTMTPGGNYHSLKGAYDRRNAPKNLLEKFYTYLDMLQIKSLTLRRSWFISHIMFAVLMGLTFIVRDTMTATILVALIGIPWTLTNWAPFAIISSEISKSDAMRRGLIRPTSHDMGLLGADEDDSADQAGVILGIHNVAIAAPQVIATLVSSVIFKALQKPRGIAGDDSVAWVLRFGGICAIIAAFLTLRLGEEKSDDYERRSSRRPSEASSFR